MKRREAFTLIELLVVIAIISLLVSILLPSLNRAKGLAKEVLCLTRQKQIGYAFSMYADDNNDYMCGVLADNFTVPDQVSGNTFRLWTYFLASYVGMPPSDTSWTDDSGFYGTIGNDVLWCPTFTDSEGEWETGYGLVGLIYGDFRDPGDLTAVYENTIPNEPGVENAKWSTSAKDCRFYRRSEFYRPEVRGWITDSTDWHTGGGPNDAYVPRGTPEASEYPHWDAPGGFARDPERHGGRCNILFVNGNARSLGYMVSGHAFWDIDNVPQ